MAYKKSILDQISDKISPSIRRLKDIHVKLVGTKTNVIRITQTDVDLMGDKTFFYSGQVINNVIIRYPFTNVEMFGSKDTGQLDNTAIDLFDLLPISMVVPFEAYVSGEVLTSGQSYVPIEIDENDIIVDVLYDSNNNTIPLIMKVSRMYAGFFGKNQTNRKYELTLLRGQESESIENVIHTYISGQIIKS